MDTNYLNLMLLLLILPLVRVAQNLHLYGFDRYRRNANEPEKVLAVGQDLVKTVQDLANVNPKSPQANVDAPIGFDSVKKTNNQPIKKDEEFESVPKNIALPLEPGGKNINKDTAENSKNVPVLDINKGLEIKVNVKDGQDIKKSGDVDGMKPENVDSKIFPNPLDPKPSFAGNEDDIFGNKEILNIPNKADEKPPQSKKPQPLIEFKDNTQNKMNKFNYSALSIPNLFKYWFPTANISSYFSKEKNDPSNKNQSPTEPGNIVTNILKLINETITKILEYKSTPVQKPPWENFGSLLGQKKEPSETKDNFEDWYKKIQENIANAFNFKQTTPPKIPPEQFYSNLSKSFNLFIWFIDACNTWIKQTAENISNFFKIFTTVKVNYPVLDTKIDEPNIPKKEINTFKLL